MSELLTRYSYESNYGSEHFSESSDDCSNEQALRFRDDFNVLRGRIPNVIDFKNVMEDAADKDPAKTITKGCTDLVQNTIHENGQGFYTDSYHKAELLNGMDRIEISRTSVAETSAHKLFFASLFKNSSPLRVAVKGFNPEKRGTHAITEWVNTLLARKIGLDTF